MGSAVQERSLGEVKGGRIRAFTRPRGGCAGCQQIAPCIHPNRMNDAIVRQMLVTHNRQPFSGPVWRPDGTRYGSSNIAEPVIFHPRGKDQPVRHFVSMRPGRAFELQMIPDRKFKLSRLGEPWIMEFDGLHAALEYAKSKLGGECGEITVKSEVGTRVITLKL